MTVVLLDPLRPTTMPIEAAGLLAGGVRFTDDVPDHTRALVVENPDADVLLTTSAEVAAAYDGTVIAAAPVAGSALLEAVDVMDRLWKCGGWEAGQTHRSLAHYLVEETYEVLDAIDSDEREHLREELGDLLLQVLFHARISSAAGGFDVDDVAAGLVAKLVHRSPHLAHEVIGPIDVAEQERMWEVRKAAEKARQSVVDGIAMSQPPRSLAQKVIARATDAGLPAELVPESLTARSTDVAAAESALRTDIDAFIAQLHAAEASARADGVAARIDWRRHWC